MFSIIFNGKHQQTQGCPMGSKCSPPYLMENIINKHRAALWDPMGSKCSPSYLHGKHQQTQGCPMGSKCFSIIFNGKHYQQTQGCPMGSKCSPSYLMENINKNRAALWDRNVLHYI